MYKQLSFHNVRRFDGWEAKKFNHDFFIERWGKWIQNTLECGRYFWNGSHHIYPV